MLVEVDVSANHRYIYICACHAQYKIELSVVRGEKQVTTVQDCVKVFLSMRLGGSF